jgi:UDP-N-acetyl-D-glucosamine dehydrogenase
MESRALSPEMLAGQDCVVIVADHSAYDWRVIAEHSPLLVDTRGATRGLSTKAGRIIRA